MRWVDWDGYRRSTRKRTYIYSFNFSRIKSRISFTLIFLTYNSPVIGKFDRLLPGTFQADLALGQLDDHVQWGYPHIIGQVGTDPIGIFYFSIALGVNGKDLMNIKAVGEDNGFCLGVDIKGFIMADKVVDKGNGVPGILTDAVKMAGKPGVKGG